MKLSILLITTYALCLWTSGVEGVHTVVNNLATNQVEFNLMDDRNTIELLNHHRSSPSNFKFTLNGVNVGKISYGTQSIYSSWWSMELGTGANSLNLSAKITRNNLRISELVNVTQHHFEWPSGGLDIKGREVCFHFGNSSWYASFPDYSNGWPIKQTETMGKFAINSNSNYMESLPTFMIVEHVFLASNGFALILDHFSPLFVRRDPNQGDPLLCISVNNSHPYLESDHDSSYKDIRFTILSGKNLVEVYETITNFLRYFAKPIDIPDESLFRYPIWYTNQLGQERLIQEAHKLAAKGFKHGSIHLDHYNWQEHQGDFDFTNKDAYPDPAKLVQQLHEFGFNFSLTIEELINKASRNYVEKYLLKDSTGKLPALFSSPPNEAIIDFESSEACDWFEQLLSLLQSRYHIDSFRFNHLRLVTTDIGFSDPQVARHTHLFAEKFLRVAVKFGRKVVVKNAFKSQGLPLFVTLHGDNAHGWHADQGIKSLIPRVLATSIGGYSFVIPGIVGGWGAKPSDELFIRWMQACIFMPAIKFQFPDPFEKLNQTTLNIVKKFLTLREQHSELMIEIARKDRLIWGRPLIRPMWYFAPDDPHTYTIDDQYMLGGEIVVAPVLEENVRERTVYLPKPTTACAVWVDQHGRDQPVGFVKVQAPIDELPYFKLDSRIC